MPKIALLVCNSEYTDKTLNRLIAPTQDASSFAEVLKDSQIGQFDIVEVLSNESSQTVLESVAEFFSNKKPDDLLLLYFTGHGVLDENGHLYLATSNTNRNILRATSLSAKFITEEMNYCRSRRQILILDCCHSGAFARGAKGSIGQEVGTGPQFQGSGYGRVVLTATDSTQYAWEGNSIKGKGYRSIFTESIVEGLRTGEADRNNDGAITIDELYDYAFEKIIYKNVDKRQTPGKWAYKQEGEIVLVNNLPVSLRKRKEVVNSQSTEFRPFDMGNIVVWDWSGVNFMKDSQGRSKDSDSIQYRVIRKLQEDDYQVIFNDHGAGEAADIVTIRITDKPGSSKMIEIEFYHCKYSQTGHPGKRLNDLYEVCGQATKSTLWVKSQANRADLFSHLLKRDIMTMERRKWSRFERGDREDLLMISKNLHIYPIQFKVFIVQPGLSKKMVNDGVLELLKATENHLNSTCNSSLGVIASP